MPLSPNVVDKHGYKWGFDLTCPHCARKLLYRDSDLRHNHRYPRDAYDVRCRACSEAFPLTVYPQGAGWFLIRQWGARNDGPGGALQFYPPQIALHWEGQESDPVIPYVEEHSAV